MGTRRVLFSDEAGFGGLCFIADRFNCPTVLKTSLRKYYDNLITEKIYLGGNRLQAEEILKSADHIIVFGIGSFNSLVQVLPGGMAKLEDVERVTVIISDSFIFNTEGSARYLGLENLEVLVMPDLIPFLPHGLSYRPFYQAIPEISLVGVEKSSKKLVSHSPGFKFRSGAKGTFIIEEILGGYQLDIIHSVSWEDCLKRKARSWIFIDQIVSTDFGYKGGLGKSGLEAMLVGSLTLTSGEQPLTLPHFPPPPVILVDESNLLKTVKHYLTKDAERLSVVDAQQEWVRKYSNVDFVVGNILGLNPL